jgi:dienelactone hydrolase
MAKISMEKRIVPVGPAKREGILRVADGATGLVIFAHGAGSSRFSPRNNHVADELGARGMASLLFDLLSEAEALDRANVFDIPLLGERMTEAVAWARGEPELERLPIGVFGSSTGAAAALVAAAAMPGDVAAVVSRGGRPDLAGNALGHVRAPTLLIVGGEDHVVIGLNESAALSLKCEHRLTIVPGATHLFEEPGTLDQVVGFAAGWFETHFTGGSGQ